MGITDQELPEMGKKSSNQKTLAMMIICKEADMWSPAVKHAIDNNSFIQLSGLTEENTFEYMGHYIGVPEVALPPALRQFVAKVTMGNPLHIRETIGQLFKNQHISLEHHPPSLECKDLKKINIANWQQTAMVGGTICLLESLDPLEAAVLKMSTCFTGPFTLPDLAASTCSRWADATHFDNLRLFNSVRKLIRLSILEEVAAPESSRERELGPLELLRQHAVLSDEQCPDPCCGKCHGVGGPEKGSETTGADRASARHAASKAHGGACHQAFCAARPLVL